MKKFKISVVIPVKNGADTLEKCLGSLRNQTIGDELEIIIPDSMSTDGSREMALKYGAIIIDIATGTFNHGLTRNTGVQHASGELVFLTVQDAWIAENDMLEKMAKHFEDPDVMAVVGHQAVPHEKDKNPLIWYNPCSKPGVTVRHVEDKKAFKKLTQEKQQSLVGWDDVVSMYRKSALIQQPFVKTEFAEDWVWSYHALLNGWKLLHDSSLIVYHYHHQSYKYAFNLAYTYNYHFYKFFKYKPSLPSLVKPMMRATYHLLKNKKLSFKEKLYWIIQNGFSRWANYFSTINFLTRLKVNGESGIEKGYNKYCKTIPQGKQKK